MPKFNKKKVITKTRNLAGGRAFGMDAENELLHAVLTTFLESKPYESGDARIERIVKLVGECEPEYVAKLAVVARTEFNLRSVTHVLIGELSRVHSGNSLVKEAIVRAAIRPDDVLEIAAYVGTPMPKQVKRGIRNAILNYSRYQLAKYKGEGKGISMVDVFNMTHPKVEHASKEQKKAWKDLIEGKLVSFDTWETEISNAKNDKERTKIWENLINEDKLGYMALLRNINNLIKYKISPKVFTKAMAKLTNREEVKKSKQLPFRYVTAYENVTGNREASDAIAEAMDIAVDNTPELKGNILIAVDTSGSMKGEAIQKASIFAATLFKANKKADLILYDTSIKSLSLTGHAPVIEIAKTIEHNAMGGGTQTSLVFGYAMKANKKYSRIIILSDSESWNEDSVQGVYEHYKKTTGEDPYVYAIDIQGYGTRDIQGKKIFHLTGWSDRLLDFIGRVEDGETLLKYIKNYELKY